MKNAANIPLVTTIRERCRTCYTCVRECPAKAIRIAVGQAEVVAERCIGCGNCVRVCTQHAKRVLDATAEVAAMMAAGVPVAAIVAPSFPAEFAECDYARFVGMLRALGFSSVHEVAFGADLVADRYARLLEQNAGRRYIATTCPAIIAFVEYYHPDVTDALAPIVSPMVAEARVVKRLLGDHVRVVFIGPCIAKKGERASSNLPPAVDTAMTFAELRGMLARRDITPENIEPSDFDEPHGGAGALFPIRRGLLQAAGIKEDLADGRVVSVAGRSDFVEAVREFESGNLDADLLEVLACTGCINGPGIVNDMPIFRRRSLVGAYAQARLSHLDWERWRSDVASFADLDLSRQFTANDQRLPTPSPDEIGQILRRLGKSNAQDELNCGTCGYDTCRDHAVAILKGLAEDEMCLPHVIEQLRRTITELAESDDRLAETREALIHSEKLASMGQLAAGVAHELNNPLGVVLMYAHLLRDEHGDAPQLREDLDVITEQADRCKKIVASLLNFARQSKVERNATKVRDLIERALRGAPVPGGVTVETACHDELEAMLDAEQMLQVLTNLFTNAYGAMPHGGTLTIRAIRKDHHVTLEVTDTGIGIPMAIRERIFDPFFTTKEIGMGTGLGLAVTYGIIKMHNGTITVKSNDDPSMGPTGTTFAMALPA